MCILANPRTVTCIDYSMHYVILQIVKGGGGGGGGPDPLDPLDPLDPPPKSAPCMHTCLLKLLPSLKGHAIS